ncbi:DUF4212 domain-containing protein [Herminiimonas sp. NPDC097707]|uniref:DUF4212 domain-containing protein n=1 Tax=Herminiimonas sp. NPDC097707 TaxID=3364007 RepID=UPI00383B473A
MAEKSKKQQSDPARRYWQRTRRMTLWLLLTWFAVTFIAIFFARPLSAYTLLGWPISFFMAAQGSILIYVAIIAIYALRMRALDKTYLREKSDSEHAD